MSAKRFPYCDLFTMPQRSEGWHAMRGDKLTGSQVGPWIAEEPQCRLTVAEIKGQLDLLGIGHKASASRPALLELLPAEHQPLTLTKTAQEAKERAICRILGTMSRCEVPDEWEVDPDGPPPKSPGLWAVWNGIRMESEAVAAFERDTGLTVEEIGFCRHKSRASGVSPDGLIKGESAGFEGKAPLPATHVRYLRAGVLPEEYRWQVQFSMAVTGAAAWWFQSYCPGLPSLRVRIVRDETTKAISRNLSSFASDLEQARLEMAAMWEQANSTEPTP